jgi:hypothetical protein
MFPHERSLVTRYKGRPFVLLGVNEDPERSAGRSAETQGKVTWRSWWDAHPRNNGRIRKAWKIDGLPALFLIDSKGVIQKSFFGVPDEKELEKAIEKYVREAEGR